MVTPTYVEPKHPQTNKALTDLDRVLLQLHFISVELMVLLQGIDTPVRGQSGPPPDLSHSLMFSLGNHASLLTWKFMEIMKGMKKAAKLSKMVNACNAAKPLIDQIKSWPGLKSYRDRALAHPYLTKQGKFVHPSQHINDGDAPSQIPESLLNATCAYFGAAIVLTVFSAEYQALDALFRQGKKPGVDRGAKTGAEIEPALIPLIQAGVANLAQLYLPATVVDGFAHRAGLDLAAATRRLAEKRPGP